MIRNEAEYTEARQRLSDEGKRLEDHRQSLRDEGLTNEQIKRLTDPMESFRQQLADDVSGYEMLMRGEFSAMQNLYGLGRMLVGLRIYMGLTQAELAERLGVDPSQVSRDERNEYHNITIGRVSRILDALRIEMTSQITMLPNSLDSPIQGNIAA
jgi:DNA-binding XRE family transcriptional regulator